MHIQKHFCSSLTAGQTILALSGELRWVETTQERKTQSYLLKAFHQVPWVQLKNISNDGDWRGTRRLLPSSRCTSPCSNEKAWGTDQQEDCGQSQEVHGGQRKRCRVSEESELGPANLRLYISCRTKAHGLNQPISASCSCWGSRLLINLLKIRMNKLGMNSSLLCLLWLFYMYSSCAFE